MFLGGAGAVKAITKLNSVAKTGKAAMMSSKLANKVMDLRVAGVVVKGVQFTNRGAVRVGELAKRMKSLPESQFLKVWNGLGNISSRTKAYLYIKQFGWKTKPTGIQNAKLQSITDQLYRDNATVGGKGTADALRYEKITGMKLSDKGHFQKANDRLRELEKLISSKTLQSKDLSIASSLRDDLADAIKFYNSLK